MVQPSQDATETFDEGELDEQDDAIDRTYLVFELSGERYALPVRNVNEIVRLPAIVAVPDVPPYVLGAASLRGNVVPVMDLRVRFGLTKVERHSRHVLILVEHEDELAALLVDAVKDAVEIADTAIERAGADVSAVSGCVRGLARTSDDRVEIVLDVAALLGTLRRTDS